MELAGRFYKSIGSGATLKTSWHDAIDEIKISHKPSEWRSLVNGDGDNNIQIINDRYPWELKIREGAEQVNQWNLPDVSNNPLFKLPKLDDKYYKSLPKRPFHYLKYYAQEDAATFYGRGYEIRDLYETLQQTRNSISLLYGKSGVGKSSLLNAGLIPRIEKQFVIIYVRRDEHLGLLNTLKMVLTGSKEGNLASAWQQRQKQSDKPLLVILDQVEEYQTKPITDEKNELSDFFDQIHPLFKQSNPSNGQLLLAYRKEYHVDIEKQLKERHLAYSPLYLEPLNRNGIIEAVQGMAKHKITQKYYRYSVEGLEDGSENDLASIIADDLLENKNLKTDDLQEDQNSPIAPLLQIHLSNLWKKVKEKDSAHFTVADYQSVGQINLDDFFKEQILSIKLSNATVITSGLALEILQEHTTGFGTAKSCKSADIENNYQHCGDINTLQQQLIDNYLLSKNKKDASILAHDTLGVIVLSNYANSDRPAQRTRRILNNKTTNIDTDETINNVLDEHDLSEVEAGLKSIRKLSTTETQLLTQSRKAREQREKARNRRKRLGISAVATIAGVAVVATVFYFRAEIQKERVVSQVSNANELIGFIQSDLNDKLQEVNRLDIMDDVQREINNYINNSSNIVDGTTTELIIKNKRQEIKNTVMKANNLLKRGKTIEALNVYKNYLIKIEEISDKIPLDSEWKSNIGVLKIKMAHIYKSLRNYNKSYALIMESLKLSNELSKQYPNNTLFKTDTLSAYEALGNLYYDSSDFHNALINYKEAVIISKSLVNNVKNKEYHKRNHIISLNKIAATYSKISALYKQISFINNLSDEEKSKLPSNLFNAFKEKSKGIKTSCGENSCLDMSLEVLLKTLTLVKELSESNPNNNIFYRDLVNTYNEIAIVYSAKNDLKNSSIYYSKFFDGSKEILRRNPDHVNHKLLLYQAYSGLANLNRVNKKFQKARELYEESISLMKELLATNPNRQDWKRNLNSLVLIYNGLDLSEKADLLINKGMNKF